MEKQMKLISLCFLLQNPVMEVEKGRACILKNM